MDARSEVTQRWCGGGELLERGEIARGAGVGRVLGDEVGQDPVALDEFEGERGVPLQDRKSTRLNSSHSGESRMPSSA